MKRQNKHKYTILSRTIFGNSMVMLVGNLLKNIVGFIVSVSLARYLGVSEFGVFSYVFTFIYFFEILPKLGMDSILIREISHNREQAQELLGNALSLRMLLSFVGMLFICIVITMIKGFSKVSFLVYLSSFGLLFSVQLLYETMFKVDLKMFFPVLANFIKTIVYAILVFILIYLGSNLLGFVLASLLSGFGGLFLIIYLSRKYFIIRLKTDLKKWKWLWKESSPLLLSAIFTIIYTRADIIILEAIKGFAAVGFYSAARKFFDALIIIPSCIATTLFPLMSKFHREDSRQFQRICGFGLKYMAMIILPIVIGTMFFSSQIISFFGKAFVEASLALRILMISAVFTFLNIILVNAIIASGRQIVDAVISGVSVILSIGLNFLLIPFFSYNGASLVVFIEELFAFIVLSTCLFRTTGLVISEIKIFRIVCANFILFVFLWIAKPFPSIWTVTASIILYGIIILIFNVVKNDLGYLLGILGFEKLKESNV